MNFFKAEKGEVLNVFSARTFLNLCFSCLMTFSLFFELDLGSSRFLGGSTNPGFSEGWSGSVVSKSFKFPDKLDLALRFARRAVVLETLLSPNIL